MEAANIIALAGFSFVLLIQAAAIVWWARGVSATQTAHSKALEALPETFRGFVTIDIGKGYQAQLDRLEHRDAECEGKIGANRQEAADRIERLSSRVSTHEQTITAQIQALTNGLTRLEEAMKAVKEGMDRLSDAERARGANVQPNAIEQLRQWVEFQALMKKVA